MGRRREMSELRTLLSEHRLVTVVGPPGVGKSRLAVEIASALHGQMADHGGVWRVDLSEVQEGDWGCAAIACALSLDVAGNGLGSTAALATSLASRPPTLIVLDGDGRAPWLGRAMTEWMHSVPGVRWLVTAPRRLGIEGEAALDLAPLELEGGAPDAVTLFLDRAPTGHLEARHALELARRLEGLPLAIELAAAWMQSLPVTQVLAMVREHASAGGGAARLAIDRSWELLEPWQKDALGQLSVFVGGFDAEAAQAVLDLTHHGDDCTAMAAVRRLRDLALLAEAPRARGDEPVRFSMHASVRERAREQLALLGGREGAVLRHARHLASRGLRQAALADETGARQATAWLGRELENLLTTHRRSLRLGREGAELALEAALALDPLLAESGPGALRLSLLDAALAAATDVAPDLRARALEARADAHRHAGRAQDAVADAQAALTLATSSGVRSTLGRVLRGLATITIAQGKLGEGRGLLERACTIDRETGQRREEGRALGLLGSVAALEGQLDRATSVLERAVEVHREVGDLRFELTSTGNLAVVSQDAGRLEEARAHGERALTLCLATGNRVVEAEVLGLLATVAHEAGQLEEAGALYGRALATHRGVGSRRGEGMLLGYQGALLAEVGDVEAARAAYARALALLREGRDRPSEALVLGALAAIEAREGSTESARAALGHALDCLEGVDEPRARAAVQLWRGHLELALAREARAEGDESRAEMLLQAARDRLASVDPGDAGEVRRAADVRLALRALRQAIDGFGRPEAPRAASVEGPPADAPAHALVVCAQGRWFRSPGGEVVSIARWRPLQRLLERLAERREIAPGEPLSVDALIAAGWPGERMLPKAGATRVYTAIASLRRIGLRDLLIRDDRGYLLRPDVDIARISPR